jgi:hypothetical protein
MIRYDDLDDAILGYANVWHANGSRNPVLVYDAEKIITVLMSRNEWSDEEAREWVDFNIEGGYLGPSTPLLVWPRDDYLFFFDDEDDQ